MAHAMAMEFPMISADVVEVQEFPALGQMHRVMSVPKTVINNTVQFTGAVSEEILLSRILEAVGEVDEKQDSVKVYGDSSPLR
ncbi:MAG: thioredoxin family protein [Chloroflexi bacterium]|nr:thioredoxin family protein [Chloroflexota bacterium]